MAGRVKDPATGLTVQQERFCQAFVRDLSLTGAYREAYVVQDGTKKETIHNRAFSLSRNAKVAARIETLKQGYEVKEQWTRDRLIEFIRENAMDVVRTATDKRDKVAAMRLLGEMQIADAFAAKKTDATVRKVEPAKAKEQLQAAIEKALSMPTPKPEKEREQAKPLH